MKPPSIELRTLVFARALSIRDETDETCDAELAGLIARIDEELLLAIELGPPGDDDPYALAAACDGWASLVSHALAQAHAPMSPFPRNRAGWGRAAIQRVQQFAATLRTPLSVAQQGLQASSYSISVGFPWGVSVGFAWP